MTTSVAFRKANYLHPDCLKTFCPAQVHLMSSILVPLGCQNPRKSPTRLSVMMDAWVPHIAAFSLTPGRGHDDLATLNSLYNKEFLCSENGIEYRGEDWAETGLPCIIVGDHVFGVAADLGVGTVVMQPCHKVRMKMRAVERALHLFSKALVGLPFKDAMRVLVLSVIRWNGQALKYRLVPSDARSAHIHPTPVEITKWGYNRVCGQPRDLIVAVSDDKPKRPRLLPPNLVQRRREKSIVSSTNRKENL